MPFALAELALAVRRRRIGWAVLGVMVVPPLAAVPFLLELMKTYRTVVVNSGAIYFPSHVSSVTRFYEFLLNPAISVINISLLVILIARTYDRDRSDTGQAEPGILDDTLFLALSFLALPVLSVALAILTKGPFIERYSLSAVIGVALILGLGTASLGRYRKWLSFSIAVVVACSFLMDTGRLLKKRRGGLGEVLIEPSTSFLISTTPGAPLDGHDLLLTNPEQTLPIVLLSGLDYTYLFEYLPHSLRPRLWYIEIDKSDTLGQLARAARDWAHVPYNLSTEQEFRSAHSRFFVYGRPKTVFQYLGSRRNLEVHSIRTASGAVDDYMCAQVVFHETPQ
jgi:hypothetical protein